MFTVLKYSICFLKIKYIVLSRKIVVLTFKNKTLDL